MDLSVFFKLIQIPMKSPNMFIFLQLHCLVFHKSTVMEASHSCVSRHAIIISSRRGSNIPKNRDEEGDIVFFPQAQGYADEDELRSIHLTVHREFGVRSWDFTWPNRARPKGRVNPRVEIKLLKVGRGCSAPLLCVRMSYSFTLIPLH